MAKRGDEKPTLRGENLELFNERPITLEGFVFRARVAEAIGKPTPAQWINAFNFATAAEDSSPFWVGDLWNYAESRADWRKQLPQMLADVGRPLAQQTIYNLGSVSTKVRGKAREVAPSVAHAKAVAALPPEQQVEMLESAQVEGW